MAIQLLPQEVASQIAAGEVVERPASVVKELLENALDAGASFIVVKVEGAGKRLVEVADDGAGIPPDEIELAAARHATSKLRSAEDLSHITTLGFRGEALASITSVSRTTITSRPKGAANAARLRIEGGHSAAVNAVGAPVGTVVRVEDLFYNVPARLKFLKSDGTEKRQIDSLVTRYALAYPRVRIHLFQDEKPALQTSGNDNQREILAALYGADVARQMLEVWSQEDALSLRGFTSPTSLTRSNRREITLFVNGRPVQDVALTQAVLQAYHTLLMVGRYPLTILFLSLPPEEVDVNVHPTKAEVRFRDSRQIFSFVTRSLKKALMAALPAPGLGGLGAGIQQARWGGIDSADPMPAWMGLPRDERTTVDGDRPFLPPASPEEMPPETAQPTSLRQSQVSGLEAPILRLVGQIAAAYLVAEGPDGLYLVDQHAAHERVLYEKMVAQHLDAAGNPEKIPSQALLQPALVELPASSARLIADQLPLLQHLGFHVEPFGPGAYLVRAVPALLQGMDPASALRVLVEDFEEDETPLQAELEARIIARVCKRAAVKAGQALSVEEQRALLHDLESCQSPRTCPHGRPTMIHLSVDLLERQFGRKGAR
jgi:DNA mismatch repair protein MutL